LQKVCILLKDTSVAGKGAFLGEHVRQNVRSISDKDMGDDFDNMLIYYKI
jgi:hypothetical protein